MGPFDVGLDGIPDHYIVLRLSVQRVDLLVHKLKSLMARLAKVSDMQLLSVYLFVDCFQSKYEGFHKETRERMVLSSEP